MIEAIRSWVMSICATLFFITASEMILPENSIKKYAKFVLGLILITVILNPILKILNGDINLSKSTNNILNQIDDKNYKSSIEKYRQENINNTLKAFKENLTISCERSIREKFPNKKFQISIDVNYSNDNENFQISKINVITKEINKNDLIAFLSEELKINKDIIIVRAV